MKKSELTLSLLSNLITELMWVNSLMEIYNLMTVELYLNKRLSKQSYITKFSLVNPNLS